MKVNIRFIRTTIPALYSPTFQRVERKGFQVYVPDIRKPFILTEFKG